MKNCVIGFCCLLIFSLPSSAQQQEIEQLILDLEKLSQLKGILQDLKKGYEIVFAGYTTIKNISEKNFDLHKAFLDGLLQVSPAVGKYYRIQQIISLQLRLIQQYKTTFRQFTQSGLFSESELDYISRVDKGLVDQSLKNLEDLTSVLTSGKLRMSDDERLNAIDKIFEQQQDQFSFLQKFTSDGKLLALQRARESHQLTQSKNLFGITH
ncbi:MAG: TerB family tellurite resistance protein [Flavisolibacter sp.]